LDICWSVLSTMGDGKRTPCQDGGAHQKSKTHEETKFQRLEESHCTPGRAVDVEVAYAEPQDRAGAAVARTSLAVSDGCDIILTDSEVNKCALIQQILQDTHSPDECIPVPFSTQAVERWRVGVSAGVAKLDMCGLVSAIQVRV
jgi:hypothetical protein